MELTRDVKPSHCLLAAFRFVIAHRWPCLVRAVPVVVLTAIIAWLETNILAKAEFFTLVVNELLYAIFAVYWHRYTVLTVEREGEGFGLHFGIREIKFAAAMLIFVFGSYLLGRAFVAMVGDQSVLQVVVFSCFLLLCFLPLILVFPAIALDQPVHITLFITRTLEIFIPLLGTVLLGIVAAAGIYLLVFLPTALLAVFSNTVFLEILGSLVATFVVMPFILAVSVSFISILFRETIGVMPVQSQ